MDNEFVLEWLRFADRNSPPLAQLREQLEQEDTP